MLLTLMLVGAAQATCPSDVAIHGALTCSSNIEGSVDHEEPSFLGGECDDGDCYTCGDPYANENQTAPEAVYSFECQQAGTVKLLITDLPCDLDMYVLDDSCDPNAGCLYGSTAPYAADDSVEFLCSPGETYYIVIEAYGTDHLDQASGPCTDDGTATGNVYSPTYTLSFDVSESTGCAEDCDDGLDNDLDGDVDCADSDCLSEDLCCDHDHDDAISPECGGDDCDDEDPNTYIGAPEDGGDGSNMGDGKDNDCDGDTDEGMLDTDDDGDGYTELDGDCDDGNATVHPGAEEVEGDGIDNDCDDEIDEVGQVQDTDDSGDGEGADGTGEGEDDKCGCSSERGGAGSMAGLLAVLGMALVSRRRS